MISLRSITAVHSKRYTYMMKYIILFTILIVTNAQALACKGTDYDWEQTLKSQKHTLKGPFSVDEMETNNLVRIYGKEKKSLPFGNQYAEWVKIKNMYKQGDKLYSVSFDHKKWETAQHVLVRNGCIIARIIVAMS